MVRQDAVLEEQLMKDVTQIIMATVQVEQFLGEIAASNPMIIVGLTGGISCGKSTVASVFKEYEIPTIDADKVAREVVMPGTEALSEIVKEFGEEILNADGTLDRKKLGNIVFNDDQKRQILNGIVHPRIVIRSAELIAVLRGKYDIVFYEAALLVENNAHKSLDALVVVTANEEVQLKRLMARDNISEAVALTRIRAQLPISEKIAVANFVIDNSGELDALYDQVDSILVALDELAHKKQVDEEKAASVLMNTLRS